ncbi:MAG: hypothetical protein ABSA27_08690, partial [Terriglobales bacterium]
MSSPLVEPANDSVAAYSLITNKNLDARWINGRAASSHCRENASPIRIGASQRGVLAFANAIMTTDTRAKIASARFRTSSSEGSKEIT